MYPCGLELESVRVKLRTDLENKGGVACGAPGKAGLESRHGGAPIQVGSPQVSASVRLPPGIVLLQEDPGDSVSRIRPGLRTRPC